VTKKLAVGLVMCMAAASVASSAPARPRLKSPSQKLAHPAVKGHRAVHAPHAIGTVTYDTGANNAGFFPQTSGLNIGNRFNSDMGGPLLMTGQLTMATFFPQAATAFITAFGPPNSMGTAANFGSFLISGLIPGTFNSANIGPAAVASDFLAGAWLNGSSVGVGMDNMSVSAQGFHAFQLVTHFPGAGTGFAPIANRNTLVRATGNIIVPVELMNFSVQ
jgi:hypothetical protein